MKNLQELPAKSHLAECVFDIEIIIRMIEDIMVFSNDEELWDTLLLLLEKQTNARVSLWKKQGRKYFQIKSSPFGICASQHTIVASVFKDCALSSISHDSPSSQRCTADIALPVFEGVTLCGVLRLERDFPFQAEECDALRNLTNAVGRLLSKLALAPYQQRHREGSSRSEMVNKDT